MDNWVTTFDALAASGVIDFDAPAFLMDKKSRYIGHPNLEKLPLDDSNYYPHGVKLKDVPDKDILDISQSNKLIENPTWKKILFGAIAIAGTILGAFALHKAPAKIRTYKISKLRTLAKTKNYFSNVWQKLKQPFNWIKTKFKKT